MFISRRQNLLGVEVIWFERMRTPCIQFLRQVRMLMRRGAAAQAVESARSGPPPGEDDGESSHCNFQVVSAGSEVPEAPGAKAVRGTSLSLMWSVIYG